MDEHINPDNPVTKYGVLWRPKGIPGDEVSEMYTEYSGTWYDDVAPALKELDRAAANPRCADARVFMRRTEYRELTKNAVEWAKENAEIKEVQ